MSDIKARIGQAKRHLHPFREILDLVDEIEAAADQFTGLEQVKSEVERMESALVAAREEWGSLQASKEEARIAITQEKETASVLLTSLQDQGRELILEAESRAEAIVAEGGSQREREWANYQEALRQLKSTIETRSKDRDQVSEEVQLLTAKAEALQEKISENEGKIHAFDQARKHMA